MHIDGVPLKRVHSCRHIGVIVDKSLTWQNHIKHVRKKVLAGLHVIKKVRNIIPLKTTKLVYNAIVSSHLDYCDVVWGNCSIILQTKFQKLQNKGARLILNENLNTPSTANLNGLNWITLNNKRRNHDAMVMHKIQHNRAPRYLTTKFTKNDTGYNMRRGNMSVTVPMPKIWFMVYGLLNKVNLQPKAELHDIYNLVKNNTA